MDFYNFFKGFFGIPNSIPPDDFTSDRYNWDHNQRNADRNDFFLDEHPDNKEDTMSFHIFSNPIEMQKYFEHQMNEVMKSFGGFGFFSDGGIFGDHGSIFGDHGSIFGGSSNTPMLDLPESDTPPQSLRDYYLKPGFESPANKEKVDKDVDGKLNLRELDEILKSDDNQVTVYKKPAMKSFGQSMSTKTVIRNGVMETHRVVTDSAGNEERTVTHKMGDKEYTVITKTDANGVQIKEEKLINITPDEVKSFLMTTPALDNKPSSESPLDILRKPGSWFDFGRYFNK